MSQITLVYQTRVKTRSNKNPKWITWSNRMPENMYNTDRTAFFKKSPNYHTWSSVFRWIHFGAFSHLSIVENVEEPEERGRVVTLFSACEDWVYEQDMSLCGISFYPVWSFFCTNLYVLLGGDTVTEGLVYTEESRSMTAIRFHRMES